jgi:FAD/FMN-containing dehydrogenase
VTHGGLTGLVHGADAGPAEVILSLERMRNIEDIDPVQRTATVQAGVALQALQEAVEQHGLAFPLDLGARGTATLGGNAATNAGGNRVIRYGMTRDMVLGLEAVLADGTVASSLNRLIKNNAGYDLKQMFIGSEGTLGVITRLVLRLREKPTTANMAFVGLESFDKVARFLKHMDRALGGTLSAGRVVKMGTVTLPEAMIARSASTQCARLRDMIATRAPESLITSSSQVAMASTSAAAELHVQSQCSSPLRSRSQTRSGHSRVQRRR